MPLTKDIFRKDCFKKLKNCNKNENVSQSLRINFELLKKIKNIKNREILVYSSLSFEANITKSIRFLRKNNKIYMPFMQDKSFKMVPFRLPLVKNRVGIYEAGNSLKNLKNIDLAIVPVVGVDANLQRVGFGKGMYDRFFEKLKPLPYTIFVQSKLCYTKNLVCDKYDIYADMIITSNISIKDATYHKKRKKYATRSTSWRLNRHN